MSFLLKNYSLVESVYLFIRCNKTKFFLPHTNNTHRNGVNKQNTHTKHLEKDNIGKGGGGANYEPGCFCIFVFWQCKRSKEWRQHFFELAIYEETETETSCFLKKILYANKLKVKKVSLNVPDLL